jgi:hypothetical protein
MKSIRLYRIGLISTFRFGLVLGLILNFLPTLIFTFVVLWGTSLLVRWLATLRSALPLPGGFSLPVSVIELLGLQELLRVLEVIASLAAWQIAALSVFFWLASALISGLLALVVVAVFNIIAQMAGGVELSVDETDLQPGTPERALAQPVQRAMPERGLSAQQGPYFEVLSPQQRILPVRPLGAVIGSDSSAGIILGGLAPRHAQVVFERGRILLVDLGGGNLWVRERPAEQVSLLEDGTMVQIGPWQMIFRFPRG